MIKKKTKTKNIFDWSRTKKKNSIINEEEKKGTKCREYKNNVENLI